jgi:carboxymethylenebutenolidase
MRAFPNIEEETQIIRTWEEQSMSNKTFTSEKNVYKITVNPAPSGGKRFPMILLVHGNFGLGSPFGNQIRGFAKELAGRGYLTAVPQYYQDDDPHPFDREPHIQTLTDAIAAVAARPDADRTRLGLIGFSLGAATAMTYIASNPPGTVKVLADFFGFLTPTIRAGVGKFPPTIILHNKEDQIVPVKDSQDLDRLLPSTTAHHLFDQYDEDWLQVNHSFKPSGPADVDSRLKTTDWFVKHLPPTGK